MTKTMMTLMMMLALVTGCSVPDDPNFDDSVRIVGSLPPDVHSRARLETASQRALKWWRGKPGGDAAIELHCGPVGPTSFDMSQQYWPLTDQFIITPLDVVNCLIGGITYQSCLERFEESAQDDLKKLNGGDYSCTAYTTDAYSDADDRADWTERRILDADIVIALLQATAPPLWYLAALAASGVAGAFPAMAPILCAQSYGDHWSCPASPNYPPGQTPQPDRGSR